MKLKFLSILIALFCIENNYAQHTDVINSNRPGESFSAFAVGKKVLQVESGINYLNDKHSILDYKANGFGLDFVTRYGFFKEELEALLEINYQNDTYKTDLGSKGRSGVKSATLGAKYLVYDPYKNRKEKVDIYSWKANHKFKWNSLIPAVAVYAGANLNFSDNPFLPSTDKLDVISPKVMLVTQNQFAGGYVFVTNIFADRISTNYQTMEYVITLTKGFNEQWSGFIENKGIQSEYYADLIFRTGAAYLLSDNLQLDASISKNLKDTPSIFYCGIGISWRNTESYEDVVLKAPKDKGSKKKSKKDKEKEKTKKRLDEVELTKP